MKLRHLSFAALALIAASCTNDNEPGAGIDLTGQPMRVTTDVLPQTRAGMDDDELMTFYLRVTNGSDDATTNYDEFTTVSRSGDTWTYNPELTWKDGTTPISVSALCQDGVTWDKTAYTAGKDIDISNQIDADKIKTADVLYMDATPIDPANDLKDGAIPVTLSHRFAKLNITVTAKTANPISLTVGGTQAAATFIPETNTLTLTGEATPIQAYQASYTAGANPTPATATYECIVLPQTATFTVTATIGGTDYIYKHPTALTFAGNTQYNLALEVSDINFTMTVADNIDVSGWGDGGNIGNGSMGEDLGGYTIAEDGTYQVYNTEGLMAWINKANGNNLSLNCTLMADIDLTGQEWPGVFYSGTFDGQGHTISGLSGKFGLIYTNYGTIKNVTLLSPTLTIGEYGDNMGGIANYNNGDIINCHVIGGSINSPNDYSGGIAGENSTSNARILACSSTADVSGSRAGGIVGYLYRGTITACYYANGSVTSSSSTENRAGSIVGYVSSNYGTVSACYWKSEGATNNYSFNDNFDITEVTGEEGNTWADAAAAMNAALEAESYTDYRWVVNEGSRPLVTEKVPVSTPESSQY